MSIVAEVLKDETLVFLDLETTGLNFHSDKIIEIGAVKVRNGMVLEKFHRLINPKIPLSFFITHLTGIKQEDLFDKPTIEEISEELFSFLDKHLIVCHNASYERTFLTMIKGDPPRNLFIDTCELSAILYPVLVSYNLEGLLGSFNIKNKETHRALVDAEDTFRLWQALFVNLKQSDFRCIQDIENILSKTNLPLKRIFGDLVRIFEEKLTGAVEGGSAVALTSGHMTENEISAETNLQGRNINESIFDEFFKAGSLISQLLPDYEVRREQARVFEAVAGAFKENKYLAIEVGIGVGKSLGYLVPAAIFAVKTKEKVVISTNTKDLQDQLANKDIPIVASALKADLKTTVVNGMDNYLCLKKLDDLVGALDAMADEAKFALAYLVSFKYQAQQGQLGELSPYLLRTNKALQDFVNFLVCDEPFCMKDKCFHFTECFFHKMIKRASEAEIIITNHSLIFSKPDWMPEYSRLIIDEAHNIEDAATNAFTETVSLKELQLLLGDLIAERSRFDVTKKSGSPHSFPNGQDLQTTGVEILEKQASKAKEAIENFSKELFSFFGIDESLVDEAIKVEDLSGIERSGEFGQLEKLCLEITDLLEELIRDLSALSSSPQFDFENRLKADGFAQKIEGKILILKQLISRDEKKIKWIEFNRVAVGENKGPWIWKFFCAPLEVSAILADEIYFFLKSAVFISAILKVAGSFSFFSERAGLNLLDSRRLFFETISSPFDFQKSVILGIPKDFPAYRHNNEERYLNGLADGIIKLVLSIRGKSLALFSSKKRMREMYQRIKSSVEKGAILTLCQDLDGTRQFLISQLRSDKRDMLVFGSKSFQEGVDISGISCVYIDKLSFPHRENPVVSARRNYLIKKRKNPFKEYELPLAIIALRQQFSRLIRKKSDFGLVVIFDSRLLERDYKDVVIKSLPKVQLISLEEDEFYTVLKQKFEEIKKRAVGAQE